MNKIIILLLLIYSCDISLPYSRGEKALKRDKNYLSLNKIDDSIRYRSIGETKGRGKYLTIKTREGCCCSAALISEKESRLREFYIEYFDGLVWKKLYGGQKQQLHQFFRFRATNSTTQPVLYRLHIVRGDAMPTIEKFVLYEQIP